MLKNGKYVQHALRDDRADDDRAHRLLRPQAQTASRSRTAPSTTTPTGPPDFTVQRLPRHAVRAGGGSYGNAVAARLLPGALLRAVLLGRAGLQLDHARRHPGRLRRQQGVRRRRQRQRPGLAASSRPRSTASPRRATTAASTSRRPTRPIATTATATATSTSPTATSTTSASVHAGEGEDAGGGARATTRSGATAATPTSTHDERPDGLPPGRLPARRHRPLGRRLHDRAGERRRRRVRPRVRPRPRPAGPLRHHGNTATENGTGFWSLMSSGSWGTPVRRGSHIGTVPMHMDAYEKHVPGLARTTRVRTPGRQAHVQPRPRRAPTRSRHQALRSTCRPTTTKKDAVPVGRLRPGTTSVLRAGATASTTRRDATLASPLTARHAGVDARELRTSSPTGTTRTWTPGRRRVEARGDQRARPPRAPTARTSARGSPAPSRGLEDGHGHPARGHDGATGFRYWTDGAATYSRHRRGQRDVRLHHR